jgi:hypothetical protein
MSGKNLLQEGRTYLHPLTRKIKRHERVTLTPSGEIVELPGDGYETAVSLTDADIVRYYYESLRKPNVEAFMPRDSGAVRYLVNQFGLDATLFAIDALITEHKEGEHRRLVCPDLLEASNYVEVGQIRAGEVRTIARQYGLVY